MFSVELEVRLSFRRCEREQERIFQYMFRIDQIYNINMLSFCEVEKLG